METISSKSSLKNFLEDLPDDAIVQINGTAAKLRWSDTGATSTSGEGGVVKYPENVHEPEVEV